ncbi:MAG TPA: dockerin type I domain-containing protein [Pseudobacteroides sp.]|nr:dockerin type I domain-containing protein [Pseudobacteroides sp.]
MFSNRTPKYLISILLIILTATICFIQIFAVTTTPEPITGSYPTDVYDMECYIKPDIDTTEPLAFKDFQIQLSYLNNIKLQEKTNQNGYTVFNAIYTYPWKATISKPGFLTRTISINENGRIGTAENAVPMWAGDMNQDNAINMLDIVDIAKSFGKTSEDSDFNTIADFNCDNTINISDVIIVCKHFNNVSGDYPDIVDNTIISPTPTQTPIPTSIYPIFHKFPYNVTTELTTSDITCDSINVSLVVSINNKSYMSGLKANFIYWPKSSPESKTSIIVPISKESQNYNDINILSTQLTGLSANTTYCFKIIGTIARYGEMQTGSYEYYWTHGAYETYISDIFEFNTLP